MLKRRLAIAAAGSWLGLAGPLTQKCTEWGLQALKDNRAGPASMTSQQS
jgi:hypothetical protein